MFPLSSFMTLLLSWLAVGAPAPSGVAMEARPLAEEARPLLGEALRRRRVPLRRCELESDWAPVVPQTGPVIEHHLGRTVDTRTHREPEGVTLAQLVDVPAGALCAEAQVMAAAADPRPVAQGIWSSGAAMGRPILQRLAYGFPMFSGDRRRAVVPVLESSYSWWVAPGSGADSGPEWQPRLFIGYADLYELQGGDWIFLRREEVLHMTYVPDERRR
jgi:hypothetical protein